LEPVS